MGAPKPAPRNALLHCLYSLTAVGALAMVVLLHTGFVAPPLPVTHTATLDLPSGSGAAGAADELGGESADGSDGDDDVWDRLVWTGPLAYRFEEQHPSGDVPFYRIVSERVQPIPFAGSGERACVVSDYRTLRRGPQSAARRQDGAQCESKVRTLVTWSSLPLPKAAPVVNDTGIELVWRKLAGWDDGVFLVAQDGKPLNLATLEATAMQREAQIENHLPILRIRNAWVVENGRVMDCHGVGYELAVGCCRRKKAWYSLENRWVPGATRLPETAPAVIVLAHSHSTTYYHVLFESLPKVFWVLDDLLHRPELKVVVASTRSVIVPLLEMLGVAADRLIVASAQRPLFASEVWLPPHFLTTDHYALVRRYRDLQRRRLGLFETHREAQCAAFAGSQSDNGRDSSETYWHGKRVDADAFRLEPRAAGQQAAPDWIGNTTSSPPPPYPGRVIVILHRLFKTDPQAPQRRSRTIGNFGQLLVWLMAAFPREHFVVFRGNEPDALERSIRLFRCARLVLGVHGAGLANVVWGDAGTPVVDLTHDADVNNHVYETVTWAMFQPIRVLQMAGIKQNAPWVVTPADSERIISAMRALLGESHGSDGHLVVRRTPVEHPYGPEVLHPERFFSGVRR